MAEGTITVEVSTQAAREEIDRLREELACVRQALKLTVEVLRAGQVKLPDAPATAKRTPRRTPAATK